MTHSLISPADLEECTRERSPQCDAVLHDDTHCPNEATWGLKTMCCPHPMAVSCDRCKEALLRQIPLTCVTCRKSFPVASQLCMWWRI